MTLLSNDGSSDDHEDDYFWDSPDDEWYYHRRFPQDADPLADGRLDDYLDDKARRQAGI